MRGWPKTQRNKPMPKETLAPKLANKEKEIFDKSGNNPNRQVKSFNRNKFQLGRDAKKKSFENVNSNDKDTVIRGGNEYERDGQEDLAPSEESNNNFVFLGTGRATKGKSVKKKEVNSKFPKISLGEEEEAEKDKQTNPSVSQLWFQHRQQNQSKNGKISNQSKLMSQKEEENGVLAKLNTKTTLKNMGTKFNKYKPIDEAVTENKSKFNLSNIWTQRTPKLNLDDIFTIGETKPLSNTKNEPVKPFLHFNNPLFDIAQKKKKNFDDLNELLYSDKSIQTNTSHHSQKRHYEYPPLHYKSTLNFSNKRNHKEKLENMTNEKEKGQEETIIPNLVLGTENKTEKPQKSNSKLETEPAQKMNSITKTDPDLALALKLVKMFRAFRDLHRNKTDLHSDLKQFLLEMSSMFR